LGLNRQANIPPKTASEIKAFLGELSTLLEFEDKGEFIVAKINQLLSPQTFQRLEASIKRLGGKYINEPSQWRFIIPKAGIQTSSLPDLTQVPNGAVLKVPVSCIRTGKFMVRQHIDSQEMAKLVNSIRRNGDVTYPLACYPLNRSELELLGGHRRLQACKEAGIPTVSVRVFQPQTPQEKWEIALQDEFHEPWSPMAKARAYQRMREEGISIEEIAEAAGETYETIKKHLALNELPEKVQNLIDTGKLGISKALLLLRLKDKPEQCARLAQEAAEKGWTRTKLEIEISKTLASSAEKIDLQKKRTINQEIVFQENEAILTSHSRSTRLPETAKQAEEEAFQGAFVTQVETTCSPRSTPSVRPVSDIDWDIASKHYPVEMVDLVWERVAAVGKRLPFLKALLNVIWDRIVQLGLVKEVFEEARKRLERAGRPYL